MLKRPFEGFESAGISFRASLGITAKRPQPKHAGRGGEAAGSLKELGANGKQPLEMTLKPSGHRLVLFRKIKQFHIALPEGRCGLLWFRAGDLAIEDQSGVHHGKGVSRDVVQSS